MKILKVLSLVVTLFILVSCKKDYDDYTYEFINPYCTEIVVGGVVGVTKQCYALGDRVKGSKVKDGVVSIRIAKGSKAKEKISDRIGYQEILDIPLINLKLVNKN
jgi:hypothetical protein